MRAPNLFTERLFEIEHALNMYAYSYVTLPAGEIYNKERIGQYASIIQKCHIYLIGYTPKVIMESADCTDNEISVNFSVGGEHRVIKFELPENYNFKTDGDGFWIEKPTGQMGFPSSEWFSLQLHKKQPVPFNIQYIGQAYGEDGNRNGLDRLLKHETLQKIALGKLPDSHMIQVMLIEIQPATRTFMMFNPFAKMPDDGTRVENAVESLYGTSEAQQVSLYEAALIRYFQPKYNNNFVGSFPSTNHRVLKQCYQKDMAAIIAEFCIDDIPFYLESDKVEMKPYHIAAYNIHNDLDRDIFFGVKSGTLPNVAD